MALSIGPGGMALVLLAEWLVLRVSRRERERRDDGTASRED